MTWNDYDAAVYHYQLRAQEALMGHRVVASLLFNAWFTNSDPKNGPVVKPQSAEQIWPLPLIDRERATETAPRETPAETWARLQAQGLL